MLSKFEDLPLLVLDKCHRLCVKLRQPKYRDLLRNAGCELIPKKRGHKWSSTFDMIERYFAMKGFISKVCKKDKTLDAIKFSAYDRAELKRLLPV